MRILRITLKNLASLAGEHTVDFAAEPLRSSGLFAIIGPTGSGKSTLLDAMCLALYDKTPRLKQAPAGGEQVDGISQQDSRSLLRRGAADGFAEVAFIGTDGQTLTARWSVHRAGRGKKVAGRLQPVEMVLLSGDVRGGTEGEQICGGRKTLVLKAIEKRIGLKFEQFTRAVLLAQNEFATFLRSKDDERMEILEALTGTHEFRNISQRVYQRANLEKAEITELESLRRGQTPLTESERAEKETQRLEAQTASDLAGQKLDALRALKRWHEDLNGCTASLENAQARHAGTLRKSDAAETRRSQLARIERAQREAAVKHNELVSRQKYCRQLRTDVADAAEKLDRARQTLTAAEAAEELAQRKLQEQLESAKEAQEKLKSAIAVRTLVEPAERAVEAAKQRHEAAKTTRDDRVRRLRECTEEIQNKTTRSAEIDEQLRTLMPLQPFASESSLWITRLQRLESAINDERTARRNLDDFRAGENTERQTLAAHQATSRRLKQEINDYEDQLSGLEIRQSELDREQLQRTRDLLTKRRSHLERLQYQLDQRTQLEQDLQKHQRMLDDEEKALQEEAGQITQLTPLANAAAIDEQAADLAVTLLSNAFDDHAKRLRATLEPGQKCPVCGATEHPFADNPADLELSVLQDAQKTVQVRRHEHDQLKRKLAALEAAVAQRRPRIERLRIEIGNKQNDCGRFQFDNPDAPVVAEILALPPEERRQQITGDFLKIDHQQQTLDQQLGQLTDLERQIRDLRIRIRTTQDSVNTRDAQESILSERASQASQKAETAATLLQERIGKFTAAEQELEPFWAALPEARSEFNADPAGFRKRMSTQLTELLSLQGERDKILVELAQLQQLRPQWETDRQQADQTCREYEHDYQQSFARLNELNLRLRELLGDQSIDEFRQELEEQQKSAQTALEHATGKKIAAASELTGMKTRYQTLDQQLADAQQAEYAARDTLSSWLADFSPDRSFDEALAELERLISRDGSWIESERRTLDDLAADVQRAAGEIKSCQQRLDEHRQQQTDERDAATVQADLEAQLETEKRERERLQDIVGELKNDDETRNRNRDLEAKIQAAEEKARPWRELDQLIGSADGKKFTLMAQRFTLDLLLQHANVQLRELARRYRLERLGESLNLAVIDQQLGDELRSVHSLSGGETFLVSLALALGLASLTSSRLRIESLFIDEGFGSLDEDTLEMAMNALNHLQSQGRKVGVITHVERMQDAITTQIHVRRGPGGTSRIVLPRADGPAE